MLKARTKKILEVSVNDFIKTGLPVTSEKLMRDHDFGIKSAMIRWELHDLSKSGFFHQVHSSGGRVPSDKAYRFFVDFLIAESDQSDVEQKDAAEYSDLIFEGKTDIFIKEIADFINTMSVLFESADNAFHDSGLSNLFQGLDDIDKKFVVEILTDIETLPEKIDKEKNWWLNEDEWPQVFIGKSPLTKSRNLSVVANKLSLKNRDDCLLVALGPKRMDYRKPISLFRVFNNVINCHD